jgi:predicted MFS family arabinose efflux permease
LLLLSRMPVGGEDRADLPHLKDRAGKTMRELLAVLRERHTQVGLLFALVGPAAFKSLEVVIGPFLIDRGYTKQEVGQFSAVVMIGAMLLGSVIGGVLADRFNRRGFVAGSLALIIALIACLGLADMAYGGTRGLHLPILIGCIAFGIGVFTVAAYAMYMDITTPAVAATQFSAFMGATNGCEAWSTWVMGQLIVTRGYPAAMFVLCGASLLALPLLIVMQRHGGAVLDAKELSAG